MHSSSCKCREKRQAAAKLQTLWANLRINFKLIMTTTTTITPSPTSRTLRNEIPSSKLVRQSGKTRPRHLFDGESAALVTNAISYAPNATGRTRALIVLVEFPTATRTLYCGTCHTDRSAQSSD